MYVGRQLRHQLHRVCRLSQQQQQQQPRRTALMMGGHNPVADEGEEPGQPGRLKEQLPPKAKLSFQQRMAEWRARQQQQQQQQQQQTNIGLPRSLLSLEPAPPHDEAQRSQLERLARRQELRVDLDDVEAAWEAEARPEHVLAAARHYGIVQHLFGEENYFYPVVPLRVFFAAGGDGDGDEVEPAVMGNVLAPSQCRSAPELRWHLPQQQQQQQQQQEQQQSLWTVLMTSPDEHLQRADGEYAHWLVTNVASGERLADGDTWLPYLQPIPPAGTGLHRYAIVLFLQRRPLALPPLAEPANSLEARDFSTAEFYRRHEDNLTPAGLCFFQAEWDESVRMTFRQQLTIGAEPTFEFSWPRPQRPQMQQFAFSEAFNLYLDKYRDVKEIEEEVLKEKLKSVRPFAGRTQPESKFPLAAAAQLAGPRRPSWLAEREEEKILRKGQWRGLD